MSNSGRRRFLRSLSRTALARRHLPIFLRLPHLPSNRKILPNRKLDQSNAATTPSPPPLRRGRNLRSKALHLALASWTWCKVRGLDIETIYGGVGKNKYLLETTGCGLAFYDYDNDGWLDVFLVNGWRLEGFAKGHEPHCHLFKSNRDGTFTDVTKGSGTFASFAPGGGRLAASAITTTMDMTICLSPTMAKTRFITTTATEPLRTSQNALACSSPALRRVGIPAARGSTTTAMGIWICLWRTMWTLT